MMNTPHFVGRGPDCYSIYALWLLLIGCQALYPSRYWWRIGCSACGGGHPTLGTRSSGSLPPWPALRSAFSGNSPPVSFQVIC